MNNQFFFLLKKTYIKSNREKKNTKDYNIRINSEITLKTSLERIKKKNNMKITILTSDITYSK